MENEKVEKVLAGCLDNLPDMELTSILLFFSSTFTDMSVERNYLVQNAVPNIRMYCLQRGLDFQIIDMRWGVRDEASVDHSTADIVLQQVELCQKLSKGPNFVAFLGDRYGSRMLQKHIDEAEFKLLRRMALKLKQDVNLLDKWYLKNENVIPTEYLLRPITDIYPDYNNNDPDKEKLQQQAKSDWNSTNDKLLSILRVAADQAYMENLITKECRQKYFQSVTEAEVEKGIIEYQLYKEKVLCYNRAFADINIEDEKAARFVDMKNGKLDDEAAELRVRLQVARVFPLLGPDQIRKDHLYWTPVGVDVNDDQHSQYLKDLCADFEKKIIKMIDDCTANSRSNSGSIKFIMFKEILHHLHFTKNKIKEFCGRTELLEEIKNQMMVYHGEEIEFGNKTDKNESEDNDQNGQLGDQINELQEAEKNYWEEQKSLKEHLNSLGVIYCHGDKDLDIESDPNRNLKAELINIPEMKHYSRPLVLFGESGSGKTAIMAKIACEAQQWFPGSLLVVRFFGTSPSASLIRSTLVGICNQIHFMYKVQVPAGLDLESDFDYLQKYFVSLLWKINTESKPLVVILDSVDQLCPNDYAHLLYWLPLKLPPNVHMIISMLPKVQNCLTNMKQLMPFAKQYIEVPALPLDTADHIISMMLNHKNCRLTKLQKRFLLECFSSCSYPLYLKLLVDESLTWKSYTVTTDLDPGKDINGAINKIFDRLEKHHGSIVVAKFCGYLGISKEGLTETELEDILSLDDEVLQDTYIFHLPPDPENIRLPTSIRTQLIVDLKEYLVKQMSGGWTVLNWYHRQFKQAASERYTPKNIKQKLHEVLAEYFMGIWSNKVKPLELYKRKKGSYPNNYRMVPPQPLCFGEMAGKKGFNTRKLVELPYHLIKAKLFDLFCSEVACNFEFLLVKCKIFNVNLLIKDMREAIAEMDDNGIVDQQEVYNDIHTVYDTLMYGCNQIRRDPNTLATLLIAQIGPDCSSSSSIQKLLDDARQWYTTTEVPLLVPVFKCLPSPGGVLQGTIHVDTFLRGEEREFRDTVALNMDKKYLYVIQPESRSMADYLKVFDLTAEATCLLTKRLKSKIDTIKYLPKNGCLQLTTMERLDQIYDVPPENAVKFTQEPKSITVSDSGKYLAYSTGVPDIHICEVKNSLNNVKNVHTLMGHEDVVFLNITPDDKMLVGQFEKYKVIWSMETGKELFKLDGKVLRTKPPFNTYITKDNIMLCAGCQGEHYSRYNVVLAINLETGTQLYEVEHEEKFYELNLLSVHSSEKFFATGTSGFGVINGIKNKYWTIRDVVTGKEVSKCSSEVLTRPASGVENLKMFGKDQLFVAVTLHGDREMDCPITLGYAGIVSQPLSDIYPFRHLKGHTDSILSILISPGDIMMFSSGKDNLIKIWNLEKIVQEFDEEFSDGKDGIDIKKLEEYGQILQTNTVTSTCMKISRDSKNCFVGTSDGNLIVYDLEEVKKKLTCQIFDKSAVKFIRVSSTNKYVIAATALGEICIWNIESCKVLHQLEFKHKLSCLDEGNNILIAGSAGMEGNGCIWNIETGEVIHKPQLLYSFYEVAMNPSGKEFVSTMFDFPIICPVSPDDAEQAQLNTEAMDSASFQGPTHMSFSRDGSLASSGSMDGALRVITAKGQYIFRMQQKSTITCAAFSVDGQYVVTGGYRSVYVWSISDGSLKYKLRNHTDFVTNIKFDETGQFMLTTSIDKKIVLWDFNRGFSLASFLSYCPLDTIDFSPNGQYIVYRPGNVGTISVLKPNPVLKKILEGSYCSSISHSLQGAQAVALSFSSQKVQDIKNSQTCEIM